MSLDKGYIVLILCLIEGALLIYIARNYLGILGIVFQTKEKKKNIQTTIENDKKMGNNDRPTGQKSPMYDNQKQPNEALLYAQQVNNKDNLQITLVIQNELPSSQSQNNQPNNNQNQQQPTGKNESGEHTQIKQLFIQSSKFDTEKDKLLNQGDQPIQS